VKAPERVSHTSYVSFLCVCAVVIVAHSTFFDSQSGWVKLKNNKSLSVGNENKPDASHISIRFEDFFLIFIWADGR
jgi:hypothetical protein